MPENLDVLCILQTFELRGREGRVRLDQMEGFGVREEVIEKRVVDSQVSGVKGQDKKQKNASVG